MKKYTPKFIGSCFALTLVLILAIYVCFRAFSNHPLPAPASSPESRSVKSADMILPQKKDPVPDSPSLSRKGTQKTNQEISDDAETGEEEKDLPLDEPVRNITELEIEYENNQYFEETVMENFPVITIQTHNPVQHDPRGPKRNEIWVRVKPGAKRELNEIMSELSDLYRDIGGDYDEDIVVMHWVGGQPHSRRVFSPDGAFR